MRKLVRERVAALGFAVLLAPSMSVTVAAEETVRVGSKAFTESVILGEIAAQLATHAGRDAHHRRQLGGTRILWNALLNDEIDLYPEYTGTITEEIFKGRGLEGDEAIRTALSEHGVLMTRRLGFYNNYALGMRKKLAARLNIETISDLRHHAELRFGFSNEYMDRGDGWRSLRDRYRLPQKNVQGLDHAISYQAIINEGIDVTVLYTTDAEILYHDLAVLEDDLAHIPKYDAVIVYRADLEERAPRVVQAVRQLEGRVSGDPMVAMNLRAVFEKVPETLVAADFLRETLKIDTEVEVLSVADRILTRTREHLYLVVVSLVAAILAGIPLGVWAAKAPRLSHAILGTVGVIQTIPALALLVLLMPALKSLNIQSIGEPPAMLALFLYSLLPIVRNTFTGIRGVSPSLVESASALGLRPGPRLRLVELPMASPMILAGVKTAAVINVGFATLGALIGAGGYGQPILTGIRLDDASLILQGAVPAALMALAVQGLFEIAERVLVPRGLLLKAETTG